VNAISIQSRMATGVQVQRLDDDDAIAAVAIVPTIEEEDPLEDPQSESSATLELADSASSIPEAAVAEMTSPEDGDSPAGDEHTHE
ncbi:MAG: hypothetical protein AAFZ49_06560, partial [Cyanobacteria bacterium J06659_2]